MRVHFVWRCRFTYWLFYYVRISRMISLNGLCVKSHAMHRFVCAWNCLCWELGTEQHKLSIQSIFSLSHQTNWQIHAIFVVCFTWSPFAQRFFLHSSIQSIIHSFIQPFQFQFRFHVHVHNRWIAYRISIATICANRILLFSRLAYRFHLTWNPLLHSYPSISIQPAGYLLSIAPFSLSLSPRNPIVSVIQTVPWCASACFFFQLIHEEFSALLPACLLDCSCKLLFGCLPLDSLVCHSFDSLWFLPLYSSLYFSCSSLLSASISQPVCLHPFIFPLSSPGRPFYCQHRAPAPMAHRQYSYTAAARLNAFLWPNSGIFQQSTSPFAVEQWIILLSLFINPSTISLCLVSAVSIIHSAGTYIYTYILYSFIVRFYLLFLWVRLPTTVNFPPPSVPPFHCFILIPPLSSFHSFFSFHIRGSCFVEPNCFVLVSSVSASVFSLCNVVEGLQVFLLPRSPSLHPVCFISAIALHPLHLSTLLPFPHSLFH